MHPPANKRSVKQKGSDSLELSCVSMRSDTLMDEPVNFKQKDTMAGQRSVQQMRSDSPELSCVSIKSDSSMSEPLKFKGGDTSPGQSSILQKRSDSPEFSCVSMKSDSSMSEPLKFKGRDTSPVLRSVQQKRSDFSCVSMKSDSSMSEPQKFKGGDTSPGQSSILQKRSDSPEFSCVSMKSDSSMSEPLKFKGGDTSPVLRSVQQKTSDFSCVYMKSDSSMSEPQKFKGGDTSPGQSSILQKRSDSPEFSCVSMKSDSSMSEPLKFKGRDTSPVLRSVQQKRSDSPEFSFMSMRSDASMTEPLKFKSGDTSSALRSVILDASDSADQIRMSASDQSKNVLQSNDSGCHSLSYYCKLAEVQNTFKSNLSKKFEHLCEGTSKQRNPTMLNEIYTELYITESESGEISDKHEVRQIEKQSRKTATEDTPIKCNDIFKPLPGQDKPIRTVLTRGVAGIGKTVSVQKFILDWADGKENQDVHFIFPLPFREINLMTDKTLSLSDLLKLFFPETKEIRISGDEYKLMFIFDALDECRLSLDFHSSVRSCDVSESASVDVLLTNLIKGNLLPSALIWITSRPAAADLIPSECVDRVTEVRGFSDLQKEEYFRKKISDESLANRIISHLKSSRSLYIMCHIPVFCWISATVLERMLSEAESGEIPKTLTQMYTHFLIIQTDIKRQKDYEKKVKDEDMIFKLGKLAFEQLVKGNLIFYEEDLRECDIDVAEASVYSGLCTQIFREEFGLYQGKVYCFVHLSIQEHLAALYGHLSFTNNNINVFDQSPQPGRFSKIWQIIKPKLLNQISKRKLHQRAVDEALQSKNGYLDLFLRFLLGLSLESNQTLLHEILTQMRSCSYKMEETVEYIKQKIRENVSPEKSINLFHCLNELGDDSLVEEIQKYMTSTSVGQLSLSSSQWSALVFVLLTSDQHLDELNLNKFIGGQNSADDVLVKLLPVIKEAKKVQLSSRYVRDESCAALASALRSNSSHLRDLDMFEVVLGDTGLKLLSAVLEDPQCKLTSLRLERCYITCDGFASLASALRSNPSHLTQLDLSVNDLRDSGVKLLSAVLENPHCKLEKLKLRSCYFGEEGCAVLTSALRSNPSHLTELNVSNNKLGDSGVKLLSALLENLHCKIEILTLRDCNITAKCCAALASALRSNPSNLKELDLSVNELRDSGVKLLSAGLDSAHCKLEKLRLSSCNISNKGCASLTSALRLNPSFLKDLDLSENSIGDSGVKLLAAVLKNPHCKLEKLNLYRCYITDEGRAALTAQKSNLTLRI